MKKQQLTIENTSAEEMAELLSHKMKHLIEKTLKTESTYVWYTRKQTSEMLKVNVRTLHNWNRAGILTSYSIGNRVYYRSDMVESAMKPM